AVSCAAPGGAARRGKRVSRPWVRGNRDARHRSRGRPSPANLYNYFAGKHEILYFCQDNSLDRMIAALDKARKMRTGAASKLRLMIASHLRCILDEVEGSTAHVLTALPRRQQRYLLAKRERYEDGLRSLIAAGVP